ncbi:MAG: heparinase, partial [Prevotellaceae bacterium]|nr:heparinase [Prevotellaceae bacterium]
MFCLVLSFYTASNFAASERNFLSGHKSPDSILPHIVLNQKWITYPPYADRSGWDALLSENKKMIISRGEKQLNYEWKVIKATDYFEYERSGNRNIMENPNSANSNALADLALAELAEGKGRFIDQIINGVFYQTERTSWVLSAHLPVQKSKRSLPSYTEQIIDLGSAELGAFLAWIYYFLHEEMDKTDPVVSQRLRDDIYRKIILPYRNNDRFWWQGFHPRGDGMVNNWNPWCNFNVLQCMLLLENDPEQLSKDIYRTMTSVDKFINYVHADGACEEGPSYWGHAAGKLYDYLQLLHRATNGNISLFGNEMIRNMGEYISRSYVGNNWVVNFADASAKFSANGGLIDRYGKAVNSEEMTRF